MNNNNNNNIFQDLDILSILSLLLQMKNIGDDKKSDFKNNVIIKAVGQELNKIHQENNEVEEKLDELIKLQEETIQ